MSIGIKCVYVSIYLHWVIGIALLYNMPVLLFFLSDVALQKAS